ncbi:MAG: STAS domain-containing protein [Candidatus Omnitrophica bacterium]|nr:STAS domain-containing protein [Candidatus Omnitrophota bacterium]MCA9424179.1 STAS domain-containing protein [Candidatus Omnitrophota bacterium]MCA9430709.1 STAS domain-containing protein [Candidatus Omnitrophota bacterium]MCA9434992.1 STAS domain-containing protein [Candidatus Omnitrophota bacterium]MCA9441265.1 STAS domain-containing protein [Candidatus Omnitrophota bacterium]
MLRFEVTSKQAGETEGSIRLAFKGQLTFNFVPQFNREINNWLLRGVQCFDLDFREITYLDSPGLGAVVTASDACRAMGGSARILNPRRLIRHLFKSAHMERNLQFVDSAEGDAIISSQAIQAN